MNVLKNLSVKNKFDNELLYLLQNWDYNVISVCLDKKNLKETYSVWRYDPYHYCMEILLERFFFFLEQNDFFGDVIAESRGGREDMRLKESFQRLLEKGTHFISPERLQNKLTSKELKLKNKKNNISGLQIADLIAHPSRNEILNDNNINVKLAPFALKIIDILQNKYYSRKEIIYGYGKKFL